MVNSIICITIHIILDIVENVMVEKELSLVKDLILNLLIVLQITKRLIEEPTLTIVQQHEGPHQQQHEGSHQRELVELKLLDQQHEEITNRWFFFALYLYIRIISRIFALN